MGKSRPYDLQTLYAQVYEAERRKTYGRMTRDLREAKDWLAMYPEFWADETMAETFQLSARNFIRKAGDFARQKEYPMWLLLLQYNEYVPVQRQKKPSLESEPCPECGAMKLRGQECSDCRMKLTTRAGG